MAHNTHTDTQTHTHTHTHTHMHVYTNTHIPLDAAGADGLLSDPAGLSSTKLSGNIPVTPLSVP